MSYSIRVWPAHRESNLRVEAVRHIDDMSYKKRFKTMLHQNSLVFLSRCAFRDLIISEKVLRYLY